MNSASKYAVIALLVVSMTGCAPKNAKTTPPANAQAPAMNAQTQDISAGKAGALYPPPLTETPTQTEQTAPQPAPTVAQTEPPPAPAPPPPSTQKSTARKTKPSAAKPSATGSATSGTASDPAGTASPTPAPGTAPSADATTDVATTGEPASSSPIGELTPGDSAGQGQRTKETGELINNTETGLNAIKRQLNAQELETYNQIKGFLTKAKTALNNQDFDGAYILATKAKVLLEELNKT